MTLSAGRLPIAAAILVFFCGALWLPALNTPFWGDDYVFLQGAQAANLAADPWWAAFWPDQPLKFWRPLSQESFWRLVESALGADVRAAHRVNLGLLIGAACAVGLLGFVVARLCAWPRPLAIGVLGALIYASLALHLLPVHWISTANSSILVALTALAIGAWLAAPQSGPVLRFLLLGALPFLTLGALLSKESAVVLPLLLLAASLFAAPRARPGRPEIAVWIGCVAVVALWLALRARFTAEADPQYALVLGGNLIRNAISLVAWLLNVPREALRMIVSGERALGIAWACAAALPMAAAWALAARPLAQALDRRQAVAALAFVAIAYAPYFPLAWNSYAYYAAVAAILPTLLLARGVADARFGVVAATLIGLSSSIAVLGTRALDHPGLIGRARWAEATFSELERARIAPPLFVRVADGQRFYAMGTAGLAWRLKLDPHDVRIVERCPDAAPRCLAIDADGHWSWERP